MTDQRYVRRQNLEDNALQLANVLLPQLDIELTERCNNACTHCYINLPVGDGGARARELDAAQWQDILRQAADLGALTVRMTGGEPLLREDFTEVYLTARRLGMKAQLLTNGRLITRELAELWVRIPPLMPIEITVYGMKPATYDATARCPGAFEEFRRGIALLEEHRIPFIVKATALLTNLDDVDEFEAWAVTIPWMEELPSYALLLDLRARRDSVEKNRAIRAQRMTPDNVVGFYNTRRASNRDELRQFSAKYLHPAGEPLFNCGAGYESCVDAYGRLQPCMLLRSAEMTYDVTRGTLAAGIAELRRRVEAVRAANPRYLARCARCFLNGLCEQCPAKAWIEYGELDAPVAYYCAVTHAQARDIGLLAPGERSWEVTDGYERVKKMLEDEAHETAAATRADRGV